MEQTYSQADAINIVIPFRNEREALPVLLESLNRVEFHPGDACLLVDDESDDGGIALIQSNPRISLLRLEPGKSGSKKAALTAGILATKNPFILTSDADCSFGQTWLETIHKHITPGTRMLIGPVLLHKGSGFVNWLQQNESMLLLAVTMRSARAGLPLMCSGANLLFSREAYDEVGGYSSHKNRSSGDDVLLLHSLLKAGKAGISALDDPFALVLSRPVKTWSQWLQQRRRWISKTAHVSGPVRALVSLLLAAQLFLPFILLPIFWPLAALIPFFEYFPVWSFAKRYGKGFYIGDWFFFRFIYPPLVLLLLLIAPFLRPTWKGRPVR